MHQRVYPDDMKYHGDSVELEGPVMNEVTKKEAEAVIGGPVKEKPKMSPGKQPAGYRYVRGLARKAMKAGLKKEEVEVNEAIKDAADVGEYDYEGDMAKSQLRSILTNAKRLHDMLEDQTNLPEWVQSKITLAEDYILTAANYMEGEMNEEVEQVDEKINLVKAKMGDVIKDFQKSDAPQFKGKSQEERRKMALAAKLGAEREAGMREEVEQTDEAVRAWVGRERDFAIRRPADQAERDKLASDITANRKYNKGKKIGASSGSVRKNASGLTPSQRSTRVTSGGQPINNKQLGNKQFAYEEVEVVAEAEGKLAVTPKEKELAAHHGDKTKITYGDVIKARIKSAAEKAMKKGN
jgi:hypothetical protein